MEKFTESEAFCPYYRQAVELIGRRWTGAILRALLTGVVHFSDLTTTIPGISDRMLSERLKELETEGLVVRRVFPETPVRIEYHLTEKGRSLGGVMEAVATWAHDWLAPADEPSSGSSHNPLEMRGGPDPSSPHPQKAPEQRPALR